MAASVDDLAADKVILTKDTTEADVADAARETETRETEAHRIDEL